MNIETAVNTDLNYINREISWLQFNRRVLQEAQDETTPLLERTKFLSIVSTNLDEFISVRVAGLMDKIAIGKNEPDFTGCTPTSLLDHITRMIERLVSDQYEVYQRIVELLANEGIVFTTYSALDTEQKKEMEQYYLHNIFPVLTPLAVDKSRPFPLIRSNSVYLAVVLRQPADGTIKEQKHVALVEIPPNLPRFMEVTPRKGGLRSFILMEDLIKEHIHTVFTLYTPVALHCFRLTRNADLALNEEDAEDLLDEMEKVLRTRKWGSPVRLELEKGMDASALELLRSELEISNQILISTDGPIDFSYFMTFSNTISGYEYLRYPRFEPVYPREFANTDDFFSVIRERDVLVYHPYESFEAVTDFIAESAADPSVLAIKMTLYRVNGDSRIVQSLTRAAESGKQVTVVVELKARFDEERNIGWAKALEKAGCHVVYGLSGLKIHAKMTLVIRREADALKRYIHIATGNYNEVTARLFTDAGLFTSEPSIGEDVSSLFNKITGFSVPNDWHKLGVSPTHIKSGLFRLFEREMHNAALGKPARIIAKVNALANKEVADQLYAASQAGVRIDLIVRGICCLRPGVPGLSDSITVRSIVDRFLEHSRIYYFENAGSPDVWISSADWMTRNLDRRIELMCPIADEKLKSILIRFLMLQLDDNVKSRVLLPTGEYRMAVHQQQSCRSQFAAKHIVLEKNRAAGIRSGAGSWLPLDPDLELYDTEPRIYH